MGMMPGGVGVVVLCVLLLAVVVLVLSICPCLIPPFLCRVLLEWWYFNPSRWALWLFFLVENRLGHFFITSSWLRCWFGLLFVLFLG
jgi:hypothetical protein